MYKNQRKSVHERKLKPFGSAGFNLFLAGAALIYRQAALVSTAWFNFFSVGSLVQGAQKDRKHTSGYRLKSIAAEKPEKTEGSLVSIDESIDVVFFASASELPSEIRTYAVW
uniref:Uncharacterized protein n=1 Tax=Anopheles atroparvus TaxID=41427 RepID=A0A182IXR5_ANOAO